MLNFRALTGKEWDSETWKRNILLDSDKTNNLETPSHPRIPLPVELSCLLVSEETSLPLLENPMLTSSGADALKGDACSPQDPPKSALVTISPVTRVNSLHAPGIGIY